MRSKIVLMTGGTETLDFFSRQMQNTFVQAGYKILLFDQRYEEESAQKLASFAGISDTVLITFNFEGLQMSPCLYDPLNRLFWDSHDVICINIAVDHPFYYPEVIEIHPNRFHQVSIDRLHRAYLKKYYPQIHSDLFLPLAGTSLYPDGSYPSFENRTYDVVFTGNFTPKEEFDQYIDRLGEEYAVFYRSMLTELIQNPQLADDAVMEAHLHREFPDASNEEIRKTIANMIFIDAYIRFYFREKIIKTLVDHKINVHCVGKGWNRLQCKHPEYLTFEEGQLSKGCLERIANAKISLNIMPWFKDGAHDRVFNSMANGAVCVTDTNRYLCCELTDRENVIFYDLSNIEALPDLVNSILQNPKKAKKIARNAYTLTMRKHTWANRANDLLRFIHTLS